jgi:outer membrane scaffolding protein for murein synthesis (MipA/OmpV family)
MTTIRQNAGLFTRGVVFACLTLSPLHAGELAGYQPQEYSPLVGNPTPSTAQPGIPASFRLFDDSFWYRPIPQRSQSIGIDLLESPTFSFGISGSKRPGRDSHHSAAPRELGELDDSYELGLFTNGRYGNYLFGTRLSKDVSGGHEGVLGEFMAGYERQFTRKLGLSLGVGAAWADKNYVSNYYGVDTGQATRSGLPQYTPGAGFTDAMLQMTACYQLTESWSFGAKIGYSRRMGSAADSPVADLDESKQQFVTGLQLQFALPDVGTQAPERHYQPNCSAY